MPRNPSWLNSIRAPLSNVSTTPGWTWISWSVVLQELACLQLPDSTGRKPYLWPALVSIDDFTITTPIPVGITAPNMQDVSAPLTTNMHAGDAIPIPAPVGNVGTYSFEVGPEAPANSVGNNLILVVVLFENHDFEEAVIAAGYTVFQAALQAAMADHLATLRSDTKNAIDDITSVVNAAVTTAFDNALPAHGGTIDITGLLNLGLNFKPDVEISSNHEFWSGVKTTSDFTLLFTNKDPTVVDPTATVYAVRGQLQVGTLPAPAGLPFDCASGGPFPGNNLPEDSDGDVTLDNASNNKWDFMSRHGSITIHHKVDQHSSARLTACKGVSIGEKIDNQSQATILAHSDVSIGQKIDQHSTADITSTQGAITIGQKVDQHSVAKLTAATTVHIGQKIDQHSTATIIAEGDINIDQGIDQHSTVYITSLTGSITIGQAVDGASVVTLRAPSGTITIRQKVAGGSIVKYSSPNPLVCPDPNGATRLAPFLRL
jgi:hypothetical protein